MHEINHNEPCPTIEPNPESSIIVGRKKRSIFHGFQNKIGATISM